MSQIPCPCCGDPVDPRMVVCWSCYRWTNRLTPGTYMDGGRPCQITSEMIDEWDTGRAARLATV